MHDPKTYLNYQMSATKYTHESITIQKPQNEMMNPNCLLKTKKKEKISRNEKCPATGKKYKHCCGAL